MTAAKPRFIAIEGGEGSGKSTLVAALKEALGDKALFTREPGGSPYGERIREVALKDPAAKTAPPETTLCLMFGSRFDHLKNTIKPSLDSGRSVVTDRFDGSSFALNVWAQSGGSLEGLFWDLRKLLSAVPDMYIFIDVEPEEGMRRARSRNESLFTKGRYDHFDDREIDFHRKVREGYLRFFTKVPHVTIDANRPLEEVKRDFIAEARKQI